MKILIICQYFYPEPFRITDIAAALENDGNVVTVLTGTPNYPEGRFYPGYGFFSRKKDNLGGVRIHRVPIIPRGKGKALSLALNYASFAVCGSVWALRTHSGDYDMVLVYQLSPILMAFPGMIAAKRAGVPMVLYVADLWPESLLAAAKIRNMTILRAVDHMVDWIYRRSKTIFVTSRGFIDSIVKRGQPMQKLHYIPQYPEAIYRPTAVAQDDPARDELPQGFNIVFTGNIGKAQGLDVILDAAVELGEYDCIHWVIIGDGRAREEFEKTVISRGLDKRVVFLGRRPMDRIPVYLALSDAAFISLSPEPLYALTLPAKIQSYFACGIPVIGSVDGDAARVITESDAGLVGAAGDAHALARNALAMYRSSPNERKRYGENALAYCKGHFCKDQLIIEIEQNLRQALIESKEEQG